MPIPKISTVLISLLVIIIAGGSAYVLGLKASEIIREREYAVQYENKLAFILKQMNGVRLGATIPNGEFLDLDGNMVRLSDLLSDHSVISFMQPDCGTCKTQILKFNETLPTPEDQLPLILISGDDPDQLLQMRENNDVRCLILYDIDGLFMDRLGVFTYPFHLSVDRNMKIKGIYAGLMNEEKIRDVFSRK